MGRKHPSGRGRAGGMHHERIMMNKFHPGFYGKTGMRVFHMQRNWKHCPTINTDKLWSLVTLDTRNKVNKDKTVPVIVRARLFTKTAEKRIKAAGGACELVA